MLVEGSELSELGGKCWRSVNETSCQNDRLTNDRFGDPY